MPHRFNLNLLHTFDILARKGSLQGAADELFVTGSAVSKQIAALERAVGERLFERTPSGLTLTDGGRQLLATISEPITQIETALAPWISRRVLNTIRITAVPSISAQVLGKLLPALFNEFPRHEFDVMTTGRVVSLTEEDWDIGLRLGKGHWPDTDAVELPGSELVLISGTMYGSNDGATILQHESAMDWDRWSEFAGNATPKVTKVVVLNDWNTILAGVVACAGIAVVPRLLARSALDSGTVKMLSYESVPGQSRFYIATANQTVSHRFRLTETISEVRNWLIRAITDLSKSASHS